MKNPLRHQLPRAFHFIFTGLLVLSFGAGRVRAAIATWTGGGSPDGNWQTANNWGGVAPVANDVLSFAGGTQLSTTNDFSAGTMFNSIVFDPTADAFTLFGNSFTLTTFTNGTDSSLPNPNGGGVTNSSAQAQTIMLPFTLSSGSHAFATIGGGPLNIHGPVTRNVGATAVFLPGAGNINVAGGFDTNGLNNILGGWATLGTDWATLDENSNVVAFTAYTDISSGAVVSNPASNVRYIGDTANLTAANGTRINSLLTQQGAARSLTITGQLRLGSKGGIYRLGTGVMTVTGGTIVADGGGELSFYDSPFNAAAGNNLNIVSLISNDGPNVVSVNTLGYVQFGAGAATLNTYSGGTFINQGRVQITPLAGFGTGPVYVYPSGQILFNSNGTYTNSFFIGGVGTPENGGLGAFRMGGAGRIVSGTVTLMGDATIGNNGRISGPITGTGNLSIGRGSSANGHGVIQVGGAIANDYSGDTIINGSASQAADTLQINATFNNIMPHGAGKGNLVLNAGSATATANFDLNGTTQTLNGLTNTPTSPANNTVTNSSATVATLVLGDNNITTTYGGRILGALGITKIGSGTQTLTGIDTYTGSTTVSGGTLVFASTFSAAAPMVTVNSSATLNLAAVTPLALAAAGTLSMSNGTIAVGVKSASSSITTSNLTADGTTNFINVGSIGVIDTYPAQMTAIKYTTLTGALNFGLGTLPVSPGAPYVAFVSNNVANSSVDVVITAGPDSIKWSGYSSGAPNSTWDIASTPNWVTFAGAPTIYSDGSFVRFDNSASNGVVTLAQNVTPAGMTASNTSLAYTIDGGSKIGGIGSLTKQGSGTLVLDNTGLNDFSGGVIVSGGTLQIGNHDAGGNLPAGPVVDNAALVFAHSDAHIVPNIISGTGTVAQIGSNTLVLSAANTFTGAVTVLQGTLQAGDNAALGTTNGGTTVASGATLEIVANAINLGQESITVSGTGFGDAGALVCNSGSLTFVGPNAARVTMAGDTTVGGNGRFDLRANPTSNPTLASLGTGGLPRKLTKVGAGTFGLVGITVDPALGDIEVQQGIFSVEAALTGLGNVASNVFVWPGGTFQMFAVTNQINKVFTLGSDGLAFTVSATSGANTIVGPMTITNDCIFNVGGAAVSLNLNNVIAGPGKITKIGAGLLTISGNSPSYAGGLQLNVGNMTVNGTLGNDLGVGIAVGKFILNGALLGTGGLTNAAGSTLAGSGTNTSPTDISGILNPGDTNVVGTLTVSNLVLQFGATLNYDLGQTTTPGGSANDLVVVNGDLTVNGNAIAINPLGLLQTGNPYRLFNYTGNLIWNSDLIVTGPNNYTFTVDTNTAGQVNIVASGGPPVWNGGSATTSNWSDPANWSGVTLVSGNSLFFNGPARLSNVNDTVADTIYTDLNFVSGAGSFVLNGNPIILGGVVINNSSNPQTVNLGLDFSGAHTLNGASSPLIIGGGVTNTAGLSTLTLAGAGTLTNLLGATDPNSMTNILSVSSNANWTLVDNPSSAPITTPVQFDILNGTFNFGQGANAPNLSSSAAANNSRIGVVAGAPATFNMVNGTLTIAARLNTGTADRTVAVLNQSGGTLNVQALLQVSDGSSLASSTVNITGGTLNVGTAGGLANFFLASRGTGVVTVASSGVINCATLDMSRNAAGNTLGSVGVVHLNGGILAVTRIGAATSAAQAGGTPTATFNFNGGTLKANASSGTFLQGSTVAPIIPITSIVKSGGAIIDTTNFNITFQEPLQHDAALGATPDGGLTKLGSGTLTLAVNNTYTGNTVVNNGTLLVNGALGATAVTVNNNGTLGGNGTIGSNVTVNAGGTLSPGTSVGILTVRGNVTLGGTNFMELNKGLGTNDLLRATNTVATTITYGGTLALTNLAGTLAGTDTFKLFSATNYAGSFNAITPAIPAPGLGWDTNTLATDGILRLVVTVNTTPTNITAVLSGNQLTLSWPADHTGWRLQVQTNSLNIGLGANWVTVLNSELVNSVIVTIDPANGAVFYRMIFP